MATIVAVMLGHAASVEPPAGAIGVTFYSGAYRGLFQGSELEGQSWRAGDKTDALLRQVRDAARRKELELIAHCISMSAGAMAFGTLCRSLEAATPLTPDAEIEHRLNTMQNCYSEVRQETLRLVIVPDSIIPSFRFSKFRAEQPGL